MFRKWWVWVIGIGLLVIAGLAIAGIVLARRFEPFVREQTVQYLRDRFDADVEIRRLGVVLPGGSPVRALLAGGRGAVVRASGEGITVWLRGRRDLPPLLEMGRFEFDVEMATLWHRPVDVRRVKLEKLSLTIPPRGERAALPSIAAAPGVAGDGTGVRIREVIADGSRLTLSPKSSNRAPLIFDLHQLRLFDAGLGRAMRYQAMLTNATPPGTIVSNGTFGPWSSKEPSATPLVGEYTFREADLSVFKGIAGILSSEGKFSGLLQEVTVDGTTTTPDFRLTMSGNRVPLTTRFHAIVDATNGNTLLQPVDAQLGQTKLECRGGVVRNKGEIGKTIELAVKLRSGTVEDLLRLGMKGSKPMLRGGIALDMKLELPPGKGEVADRLKLHGRFSLHDARFTSPTVQEKIDSLSRRGQGRPQDEAIGEVPSDLAGDFTMQFGHISFSRLQFTVPGSAVNLVGKYLFETEQIDFHGKLRLQARVSQTMTGWKRWLLKPVDPFFAKDGAGTVLSIAVTGSRANPNFGLDRGRK